MRTTLLLVTALLSSSALAKPPLKEWISEFKKSATKAGISEETLKAMDGVEEPIARVLELDRRQPEGTMTFEDYFKRVVKPERISEGRRLLAEHREEVVKAAEKFGVEPEFIVALWGVETHFGTQMGDFPIVPALMTLAYEGRREKLFRAQLMDALRILDRGDIEAEKMTGSWAGAMGHCQFMPTTFLAYAVDQDGDGRRDLWTSLPDVFGSAANYLAKSGWKWGSGWGLEVTLPEKFDPALLGRTVKKTRAEWRKLGVKAVDGSEIPEGKLAASLVRPGNKSDRVFLVEGNYHVLLRWNRSEYFATVVSLLATAIAAPAKEEAARGATGEL